mmetsp:Transcript_37095/g.75277  ORF Transcript_37095/g.75277 Transcript_37095/m.75277 type:complete len:369 (-) Transcript_37095:124-1230(-)|eukprot:CAMPEP_0171614864 /NCGR_PEP_ID=MMETSP0990-20121206/12560_1 /TAXON_ID=483369 /ORGANISM="non described non described, Strain CCMP2098" /LENGTH=368 /DNA_ID=CAMNT_0012178869 /DNA_START=181 /DNA_END=1287 /DNA_ORIENTATION=+
MEPEKIEKRSAFRSSLQMALDEHPSHVTTLFDDDVDRYLEARQWEVDAAVEMAKEAETWRLLVRPKEITPSDISRSLPSGCWRFVGKALNGRPILLIRACLWRPSNYTVDEYVRYVAYMTEGNLARISSPPQSSPYKRPSKQIIMFDMAGFSLMNSNMRMLKNLVKINQVCYPERLSLGVVFNAPAAFVWVFGLMQPWVDPKTREKIQLFNGSAADTERCQALLRKHIDSSVLQEVYGGTRKSEYPIPPNRELDEDGEDANEPPLTASGHSATTLSSRDRQSPPHPSAGISSTRNNKKAACQQQQAAATPIKLDSAKQKKLQDPVENTRMLLFFFLAMALACVLTPEPAQLRFSEIVATHLGVVGSNW